MNVLYGIYRPDEGEILVKGEPITIHSAQDAIDARHRDGAPALHAHPGHDGRREHRARHRADARRGSSSTTARRTSRVRELAQSFNFAIDPDARVHDITVGQQQRVEILKALYRRADILILDEPTAVLTPQEAQELFAILRTLCREGMSVIFISHKLHEVLEIADRISVLRRGKLVDTVPREGATEQGLARLMVGREVVLRVDKDAGEPGRDAAGGRARSRSSDDRGLPAVRDVSFKVRAGEIVGIAGVDGNGQTELLEALTGLRRTSGGHVTLGGQGRDQGRSAGPSTRARTHPRGSPAPRHHPRLLARREPCSPRLPARADAHLGWLRPSRMVASARELISEFDVRGGTVSSKASELSGGNQQKLVVAREVSRDPSVLIAAQPTRGLDVGAIAFLHSRLVAERDEGRAILLVSLELEEIQSLSDRILVMYEGRIVGEFGPGVDAETLGIAMIGGGGEEAAA